MSNDSTNKDSAHKASAKLPPLVAIAGALGSAAMVRWAYRTAKRINRELDDARVARAEAAAPEAKTLRRDPVTGAYRPK